MYFVIEHQPTTCDQYPASGLITFTDINVMWEGKSAEPAWQAFTYVSCCCWDSYVWPMERARGPSMVPFIVVGIVPCAPIPTPPPHPPPTPRSEHNPPHLHTHPC